MWIARSSLTNSLNLESLGRTNVPYYPKDITIGNPLGYIIELTQILV